jgi:solute carrier family 25 carnitine/acylcarnitine transporter 20/29
MDLVKVRVQTQVLIPGAPPPFTSTFDCLRKTVAKDGITGIYRGVSAPIVAIAPIYAVCFWGYDMGQRLIRAVGSIPQDVPLTIPQICMAGGMSAIPTTALMAPTERVKCLLQVQATEVEKGGKLKYTGLIDCGRQLFKEGGIRSLYRGTGATLMRDVPGSMAWFGAYEIIKMKLKQATGNESGELNPLLVMVAGGFGGIANWCVSIPPDVVKSRLQTAPEGKYPGGMKQVAQVLYAEGGAGAFFKGVGPAMIRAFPANAACFLGMEFSRSLLAFMD